MHTRCLALHLSQTKISKMLKLIGSDDGGNGYDDGGNSDNGGDGSGCVDGNVITMEKMVVMLVVASVMKTIRW